MISARLMPDPMPLHRCGILTVAELEACLRVLRLASQSPDRLVYESEIGNSAGSGPDDYRAAGALFRAGYIHMYPGSHGRRIRATEAGLLYLSQVTKERPHRPD